MKGHCAFPFCKGFKIVTRKAQIRSSPLTSSDESLTHFGGKASIPSVVYKGPEFTLRPTLLSSLTSHFWYSTSSSQSPCLIHSRHPASGLFTAVTSAWNTLPCYHSLAYFKLWLMCCLHIEQPFLISLVCSLVYSQSLEWCLSQGRRQKILTDWMNEWANWLSHPVHLGGGPTTSPEWSKIRQSDRLHWSLDQKDKLTSDS